VKTPVATAAAPAAAGPYSQAVEAGGFVFVSGQLPVDPASGGIPDGAAAQAERAFANVLAVLAAAGLGAEDVVKTTLFLADLGDFAAVNGAYAKVFPAPFPARSCIQAAALPKGVRLEVDAVAVRPSGRKEPSP
jgi:2-iminobutanoate/2-iminopropanoate deaminase